MGVQRPNNAWVACGWAAKTDMGAVGWMTMTP
jgi:hypothetical protein